MFHKMNLNASEQIDPIANSVNRYSDREPSAAKIMKHQNGNKMWTVRNSVGLGETKDVA